MNTVTPYFNHDQSCCHFVGAEEEFFTDRKKDIYLCKRPATGWQVTVRTSDEPSDTTQWGLSHLVSIFKTDYSYALRVMSEAMLTTAIKKADKLDKMTEYVTV